METESKKRGNPQKRIRKGLWPLVDLIIILDRESDTARLVFEEVSKRLAGFLQQPKK